MTVDVSFTAENGLPVFREHIAPLLSSAGLAALADALRRDDPRLLQGASTMPPPLYCVQDRPVEAACAVCYAAWQGDGVDTAGLLGEEFCRLCFAIDQGMQEPAGCRWFLNWYDETPRDEMRRLLLPEVEQALAKRVAAAS